MTLPFQDSLDGTKTMPLYQDSLDAQCWSSIHPELPIVRLLHCFQDESTQRAPGPLGLCCAVPYASSFDCLRIIMGLERWFSG
ncbi:rCG24703 [Rattus norvegicus]|uniref:RCG24703 n=1 Tax=Rattus norvegicus TaxID=10116 RepID=A6JC14_RAT|nr:rCG24703 [Rattus norvegicus]